MKKLALIIIPVIVGLVVVSMRTVGSAGDSQKADIQKQVPVSESVRELVLTNIETGRQSAKKAVFDPMTKKFIWTPDSNDAGKYQVKFTVTDGKRSKEEVVTITVHETCGVIKQDLSK